MALVVNGKMISITENVIVNGKSVNVVDVNGLYLHSNGNTYDLKNFHVWEKSKFTRATYDAIKHDAVSTASYKKNPAPSKGKWDVGFHSIASDPKISYWVVDNGSTVSMLVPDRFGQEGSDHYTHTMPKTNLIHFVDLDGNVYRIGKPMNMNIDGKPAYYVEQMIF